MNSKSDRNRILLKWMRLAVWGILAVFLSRQSGLQTSALSYGISEIIRRLFEYCGIRLDIELINYLLRKLAHLIIYLVLGGLVYDTLSSTVRISKKAALSLSVVVCLIISALDEAQKFFIPGRHGDVGEIVLNSIAAAAGIFAVSFLNGKRKT